MSRLHILRTIRILLCLGLIMLLLRAADAQALREALMRSAQHKGWVLAGILLTLLGLLAGVLRWKDMLSVQGLHFSFSKVFKIFFIGQFFNTFMPGACGGDVARAYYVAAGLPGRRAEAASTVFVDRAVGLFVTIGFCCVMILARLPFFLSNTQTKLPAFLMVAFLLVGLASILVLFRRNLFEHWALFRRIENSTRLGPLIRRAYEAFYLYRDHREVMLLALLYSLLNLIFLTTACYSFARSLEIGAPMSDHLTFFPIITTLAAIPLTPGALGLREGLFATMYSAVGIPAAQSVSLSLLVYAGGAVCSLLGGVFFIGHSAREHHSIRDEIHALRQDETSAHPPDRRR